MKALNFFKALSDDTRLRLLHIFTHYELNVNEIVEIMGMGQSRISRHLKILADTQLLTYRRDGLWTFYTAAVQGEGHRFINTVKYLFDNDPVFEQDLEKVKKILEERSKETVRFFDSIAEDWEKLKREIIGDVDLNGLILGNIPVSGTIVDLGCGTGDLLSFLKEKADRVIGVEKAPRMLEEARRRFADRKKNIDLRIGELEHLPLREGEADLAVINMVLHHLPDPPKALQEAHRVLKKGNLFIIVDLLTHTQENMRERYGDRWLGFSESEMKKWLQNSGFSIKSMADFDLKKGLKGFLIQAVKNS
ncbi:MAG TPA: metalloregulator ArsR/SmtB family transcription factor [Candidatus Deferrimicrobium sp.]|nr:metalloregulator ArsR/SmtB family transcription factor [Candidatus Deferrimicrobium sp.]